MSRKLVAKLSRLVDSHTSRRGFLRSLAMSATAAAFAPAYIFRPIAAEAAILTCLGLRCGPGSACCDGWTEFCCRLTGENTCPPGTVVAGWWKVDNSRFCSYDKPRPRYYIDCNVACLTTRRCGSSGLCRRSATAAQCRCPDGCDTRRVDCIQFRYGQCNQDTCVGPIRCRVVTCVPPWKWDPACSTRPVLTSNATRHHDRPCLHDWFTDVPPKAFYADAVRWMSDQGIAVGLTDDLFAPDEPVSWEHFATLLWSYAGKPVPLRSAKLSTALAGSEFEIAVGWLVEQRIAVGLPVSRFEPGTEVSRAEAVTLLYRMAGEPPPAPRRDIFPEWELFIDRQLLADVAAGAWYADAIRWATSHEIVWWSTHLDFDPDRSISRSDAAVFLYRFHGPQPVQPDTRLKRAEPWR